jgi:hypothetical protein
MPKKAKDSKMAALHIDRGLTNGPSPAYRSVLKQCRKIDVKTSFVIASFLTIGFERVFLTPVEKFRTCLLRQGDTNPACSWNADTAALIATLFCTEPDCSTFCCM